MIKYMVLVDYSYRRVIKCVLNLTRPKQQNDLIGLDFVQSRENIATKNNTVIVAHAKI